MKGRLHKIAALLCTGLLTANIHAAGLVLKNVRFENASIPAIFQRLERITNVGFILRGTKNFKASLPRINMDFDRIPASIVVWLICKDADLQYQVKPGRIVFEKYVPKPVYRQDQALYRKKSTTFAVASIDRYYPVGWTTPKLVVQNGSVIFVGSVPRFRKFTTGSSITVSSPRKRPKPSRPAYRPPRNNPAMVKKLEKIILKNVQMQEVPITKVLDRLRKISRKHSPQKEAVNIYLSLHARKTIRITMALSSISLYKAMKYVCEAANLKMLVKDWGVIIYKK